MKITTCLAILLVLLLGAAVGHSSDSGGADVTLMQFDGTDASIEVGALSALADWELTDIGTVTPFEGGLSFAPVMNVQGSAVTYRTFKSNGHSRITKGAAYAKCIVG